jgi:zinc protease
VNLFLPLLLAVSVQQAPALPQVPQQETDTSLLQYEVNGLRVLHQRRPASSDVIAVQLYILGGSRNVTAEQAGVEQLILEVSNFGTLKYPGEETRRAIARTGSNLSSSAGYDWATFEFDGLKQDFDSTWSVFTERVMHPSLDSAAIEIVRLRMLGRVNRRKGSPEDYAWFLADSLAFAGHPYANHPGGNEASLRGLTQSAIRQYHKENMITTRMVLVVAGDIDRAKLEGAISATLGTLPRGEYVWSLPPKVTPTERKLVLAQRSSRTNYIVATLFGPARGSPEFHAFVQGMGVYSDWFSHYVRTEASLSYAAGISTFDYGVPHARLFVSTTNPDSVLRIQKNVGEYLAGELAIPRARIKEAYDSYQRSYLAQIETASGQASGLARAFLYEGDARLFARQGEVMKKLTGYDIKRAIANYGSCFQFAYVGDPGVVRKELMVPENAKCR